MSIFNNNLLNFHNNFLFWKCELGMTTTSHLIFKFFDLKNVTQKLL
jgi:hypothetical protein